MSAACRGRPICSRRSRPGSRAGRSTSRRMRAGSPRGRRDRAEAGRARDRRRRRRRARQAELRLLRQRAARRLRARPGAPRGSPWASSREARSFPGVLCRSARGGAPATTWSAPRPSPIAAGAARDRHRQSEVGARRREPAEVFMPAISPTSAADWQRNGYYRTEEEYLFALADALREEYEAIVAAGFILQVDDPHLVTYWIKEPDLTLEQCRKWAEAAGRGAQSCAAQHSAGEDQAPHLLRHQHGPAHPRPGAQGHRRHHPADSRRRLFVRGRQSAPRARMGGCGRRSSCRTASRSFPASSATRPCWSSTPSWSRSASRATRRWWGASASSPAPIAASPPSPARRRCIPASCGRNSSRWSPVPASPAGSCGGGSATAGMIVGCGKSARRAARIDTGGARFCPRGAG